MSLSTLVFLENPYLLPLKRYSSSGIVLPASSTGPAPHLPVMSCPYHSNEGIIPYHIVSPLHDNHLQASFKSPYQVNITLPQEFSVQNPLLAGISPGANITRYADNTTLIQWDRTMSVDLRFYDIGREALLYFFLQFMGILAVVMLLPFLLTMRKQE